MEDAQPDPLEMVEVDIPPMDQPIEEVVIKCEVIEISDEEETPKKSKRKRIVKKEATSMPHMRKADLDRHEKIHSGIKPYQCEICSKSFTQKNNMLMHYKTHVGDKPHECMVCGKRFITKSKLTLHSRKHDKDKKRKSDYL
ncbi:unnamed protein product [Leptosia nina]|uniref:C2H2-type domain-containing protein n=1 Tax=Leptosia nina TaxID=320188 RepID=A0AAV1JY98_9NEOP